MTNLDIVLYEYVVAMRSTTLTEWLFVISRFFDLSWAFVLCVILVSLLIYFVRGLSCVILFTFSLAFSAVSVGALKWAFNVSRPTDFIVSGFGQSFPSYHATIATVFFVLLMYIFDQSFSKLTRIVFNTFCIFGILVVGFSRVYLGAHWASDVVFGIVLGSLLSYVAILIFRFVMNRRGRASMIK